MKLALTSAAIDLGIIVEDLAASVPFYKDLLGFEDEGELSMPGGATMRRLRCGQSLIKLVEHAETPAVLAAPGGLQGATGFRYFTIAVSNMDEIEVACRADSRKVVVPPLDLRPGVRIMMVEDPDGNWVEFAEYTDPQPAP